jgi:hypothetical protein
MSSLAARHVHRPQHNAYHTDHPSTQCISYKQDAMITINSYPRWAVKASQSVASNALISHTHSNARCRHEGERSLESVTSPPPLGGCSTTTTFTHGDSPPHAPPTATCLHNGRHHRNCTHSPAVRSVESPTWGSDDLDCDVHHPHNRNWWCSHSAGMGTCTCNVPHRDIRCSCATWGTGHKHGRCCLLDTCHNKTPAGPDPACDLMHSCCVASWLCI